jgi:two-component system OmpR family response regulator
MDNTSFAHKSIVRRDAVKPLGRVMIADDNLDHVALMCALLKMEGYDVCGLPSGDAVLAQFEVFAPDVVILDIAMPNMSGYDTARALRAHRTGSQVLLVALTGHHSHSERLMAKIAGFDHHMSKASDPNGLMALIRDYLAGERPVRIHVIPDIPR